MKKPILALGLASFLARSAAAQSLGTVHVVGGLERPSYLTAPPDGTQRLFVLLEKRGVYILDHGFLQPRPFLDLFGEIGLDIAGLVGLAFHPAYATNGRFYVVYQNVSHESLLVEYRVSADPNVADTTSRRVILGPIPQPHTLHDWSALQFGPDGMLYLSTGDGGPGNDPNDRAQDLSSTFGKLLRIDVDAPPPHVPPDNPFVGVPGAEPLIWAYGLRLAWRFDFDSLAGDLWIADVGQAAREEIDFQPASSTGGENYGWVCMEGSVCTGLGSCTCNAPNLVAPIHEYPHTQGRCCIIGGGVYRGSAMPWLQGAYVFGDYCSAEVWSLRYDGSGVTDFQDHTATLAPCDGSQIDAIASFGEDADGELYILDYVGGDVFKLVPADETSFSYCEAADNSTGRGARMGQRGTTSVAANDLVLTVAGAVPRQPGIFYYGPDSDQAPFGDGYRCVAGATWRLRPVLFVDGSGMAELAVDLGAPPSPGGAILPGSEWSFQFWYRDPTGPGGTTFNLSNGLRAAFCP